MASRRVDNQPNETPKRRRPATTPEDRENQLIALATDVAERQMREGTASAQVITHYLKASSSRDRLEKRRIELDNELAIAKIEALGSSKRVEELYTKALDAMRSYSGDAPIEKFED